MPAEKTGADLDQRFLDLEKKILEAQRSGNASTIDELLADDFREIGSSGRVFTRQDVLAALGAIELVEYSIEGAGSHVLHRDCVLVTYWATLRRRASGQESVRRSIRSSLWVERNGKWQILFHQGTPIADVQPDC